VILVDASLLLYAYDAQSAHHAASRRWLEATLSDGSPVRFAWVTLWAFARISTNPRAFARPLRASEAMAIIRSWLAQPGTGVLEPGERHGEILESLMADDQTAGALVMDAALAAIAIEHGATLCTTDRDFLRFTGLRWTNPIAPE
jgi:hypothetical protein